MVKKIIIVFTALILLTGALYVNASRLLTAYAYMFRKDTATIGADAIVLLSGNPSIRVVKVIDLYEKGYSKNIYIFTVKKATTSYPDIFKGQTWIVREILSRKGIEVSVIPSLKDGATSTFDEAHDLASFFKEDTRFKHIILVTDASHTARSLYAFKKIFKQYKINVKLEIAAAENLVFNETDWWKHEAGLTTYYLESLKFIVYLFHDTNLPFIKPEN